MKQKCYLFFITLLATVFASCGHDRSDDENNRVLSLEWQSEHPGELADIHLWVFGADGLLKESRSFATLDEAQGIRLTLPAEACTLVAATCRGTQRCINTGETMFASPYPRICSSRKTTLFSYSDSVR